MSTINAALASLKETLGDFKNIKLLLDGDDSTTREEVDAELLAFAHELKAGKISPISGLREGKLREMQIAL